MTLLPGRDSIIQEAIEICSMAQAAFVSPSNFTTLPYLQHAIEESAGRVLIEKLLNLAIKARFLDDQTGILKEKDRRLLSIGRYYESGTPKDDAICIRLALNKLVHHKTIFVSNDSHQCIIFPVASSAPSENRKIPEGIHRRDRMLITVEGKYNGQAWSFEIDLFQFLNEVLRALT
jgi:hypothetical protein